MGVFTCTTTTGSTGCVLSCFSHVQLFATSRAVARQVPPSMELFRQEYWSGFPCPPPGDLPDPGIELASFTSPALQADSVPLGHREAQISRVLISRSVSPLSYAITTTARNQTCRLRTSTPCSHNPLSYHYPQMMHWLSQITVTASASPALAHVNVPPLEPARPGSQSTPTPQEPVPVSPELYSPQPTQLLSGTTPTGLNYLFLWRI